MPDIESIWSQLDGAVHLCQVVPATSRLLKAICDGTILVNSWLTSMIDGYPMFLCFLASTQKSLQGLKWGAFCFDLSILFFLSVPQLLCSLQHCQKWVTLSLATQVVTSISVKETFTQNKGNSFSNYLSFFFSVTLFLLFFLLIPKHWAVLLS